MYLNFLNNIPHKRRFLLFDTDDVYWRAIITMRRANINISASDTKTSVCRGTIIGPWPPPLLFLTSLFNKGGGVYRSLYCKKVFENTYVYTSLPPLSDTSRTFTELQLTDKNYFEKYCETLPNYSTS